MQGWGASSAGVPLEHSELMLTPSRPEEHCHFRRVCRFLSADVVMSTPLS